MGQSINFIALRRHITGLISPIHARVYYQNAPEAAVMPYLVIDIPNGFNSGDFETFILDVDAWDDCADTSILEGLIQSVDATLNQSTASVDGHAVAIYRDIRMSIPDDDKRIKRRKYTYQIKVY